MSLTAAGGFVVLLSVQVVQGWGVTYTSTEICALKGSTVDMSCSYAYPFRLYNYITKVREIFWFQGDKLDNLRADPEFSGRVQYSSAKKNCSLRITDVRESDSAEYKFSFSTTHGSYTGSPGVTLSVADLQVQVSGLDSFLYYNWADLKCHSSCRLPDHLHYVWYKNGQKIEGWSSPSYGGIHHSEDNYSCAVRGYERFPSPPVYVPSVDPVSVNPSGEIVEGTSVTLSCRSDTNPAAKYTWYKKDGDQDLQPLSEEPQLVFRVIQSSDSAEYYCTAENELEWRISKYINVNVKYGPKLASVSVSPSGEIVEGTSVNLTCSSDANPAASYTWYKENQTLFQGPEGIYSFTSISSEDRGIYHCRSENQHGQVMSSSVSVDVQYAPKLPSVSVSPSAKIVEGTSVNLTCSSDANPAANYTWYKEDEDSPKASGQIFTITDFGLEHSGKYYCEAWNGIGHHTFTVHLTVAGRNSTMIMNITRLTLVVLILFLLLLLSLWTRKKKTLTFTTQPNVPAEALELDSYPVYDSDFTAVQTEDAEQQEDLE